MNAYNLFLEKTESLGLKGLSRWQKEEIYNYLQKNKMFATIDAYIVAVGSKHTIVANYDQAAGAEALAKLQGLDIVSVPLASFWEWNTSSTESYPTDSSGKICGESAPTHTIYLLGELLYQSVFCFQIEKKEF